MGNPARGEVPLATEAEIVERVRRAQRGDAAAMEALARGLLRPAYAVALAVVARPADAEDVAQEALVAALQQLHTCRDPQRFLGWLMAIVRNRALNLVESRKLRDVPATEAQPQAAVPPDAADERQALLAALQVLTPVQREVVLLHDLEGWTHPEIAAALELSETNSRQHLFQARKALRRALGGEESTGVEHGR